MVATPNITLTITPPGGTPTDYTGNLAWAGTQTQTTISQNFGRQGDTATISLAEEYTTTPGLVVPVESQVSMVDHTAGQTLFAGVCNDPILVPDGPTRNEWTLNCTDYTFYADNAIVHGVWYGQTVDQIVIALTAQANCGITAASIADGGFVAPGPQLASFVLNYTTLSSAWRTLSQLAGQVTPFGWYVDENRALHFYDATSAQNSGVTFTTSPTTAGSLTEGHLSPDSFGYEWDGTAIRNRILVQGATQTISHGPTTTTPPTDTWKGNGAQLSWPLRYTVTGTPVLTVGGVTTPVTLVQAGSTSTDPWQIGQNAAGGWFLNALNAPAEGVILRLWYDYQVPIVAQANDAASQATYTGPNRGLFTEFISDSSLTTVPMALSRALRERQEYAFAVERINFTTTPEWLGWIRAGQTCRLVNQFIPDAERSYAWGVDDTFIAIANTTTFGDGGYSTSQITAIRL
jgi:hypothetical protein